VSGHVAPLPNPPPHSASTRAFTPVFDGLWTRVNALMQGEGREGVVAVLGLDQYVAIGSNQDRAERMIAVALCAARHLEGAAQKCLMVEQGQ
jgi:hypothetical protein